MTTHSTSLLLKFRRKDTQFGVTRATVKKMAAMYPPYEDYQKHAGARQIPVVVLDPIGPA